MACRAGVVHILKDSCFAVIAAFLLPDMEQDPAIVAKAQAQQRPHPNEPRTT